MSVPDAPAEATTPLFGSAPLHTDSLHIVPWTHPAIYGHNTPFSIRAAYNPPASFKSALQDDPVRVVASLSPASLLVTTTKKIYVFSPENPALEWVVEHGQSSTVPPWACLTGDGVLMITNDGKLAFWRSFDATGAPDSTDTISLGYNETISATSATPSAVIVGTTVGNLYFIQIKPNIIAFSLYKKPIPSSRFSALWTYLSPGADINAAGRIIKITPGHAPHEWLVFSSTLIQIWSLDPDAEAKMHYAIQIKDYIQTNVVPGLVSEIPASDAAIQILDFAKYENNGWIALLTFRDGQQHRIALLFMRQQQEFETTDVVTLPDALTSTPSRATLHISDNDALAFVTVNDAISVVVIPSRNVFESRLILRQRDNQPNHILATIPAPNADATSNTCLVLTSASGILQFTLNPSHIQRFNATEAEVHVLRSQLEQAVFFGDNQHNPLAFPVMASCSDSIGNVACALASDIINGGTPLMPTTMEMSVLLTHRLRCVKRIPEILKAQHLLAKVDQPTLAKLLRFAEAAQTSLEIYNQVIEAQNEDQRKAELIEIFWTKALDGRDLYNLFAEHTMAIPKFLEEGTDPTLTSLPGLDSREYSDMLLLVSQCDLNIVYGLDLLRQAFQRNYGIKFADNDKSVTMATILGRAFTRIKACKEGTGANEHSQPFLDQLAELGSVLLDGCRDKARVSNDFQPLYELEKEVVIKALGDVGLHDVALNLARDHECFPYLIDAMFPETEAELTRQYIDDYGEPFVKILLEHYLRHERYDDVLSMADAYHDLVADTLACFPHVSWKFYQKQGQDEKMARALVACVPKIQKIVDKKLCLQQAQLAYLVAYCQGPQSKPLHEVMHYPSVQAVMAEVELIEAQEAFVAKCKANVDFSSVADLMGHIASYLVQRGWRAEIEALSTYLDRMLKGDALNLPDFIITIALLDNRGSDLDKYLLAIHLLTRFNIDENEDHIVSLLNILWASIYIQDDWSDVHAHVQGLVDVHESVILKQTILYRVLSLCEQKGITDDWIRLPKDVHRANAPLSAAQRLVQQYCAKHNLSSYFRQISGLVYGIDEPMQ